MVRHCIARKCNNTDKSILSHRFPKNKELTKKWCESLQIPRNLVKETNKFVVCTLHFDANDYRNAESNFLNITAIPKLEGIFPRVCKIDELTDISIVDLDNFDGKKDESPERELFDICDQEDYENVNISSNSNLTADVTRTHYDEDEDINNEGCEIDILEDEHVLLLDRDADCFNDSEHNTDIEDFICMDVSCQVNEDELEQLEDNQFSTFTRSQLIELINKYDVEIRDLRTKFDKIQKAHSDLLDSMHTFKTLIE